MMRAYVCLVVLLITAQWTMAQGEWAVGVRVPEPAGLSVKKYLNGGSNALAFGIGTYGYGYGYGSSYPGYKGYYKKYNSDYYYRRGGLVIMADYLWQKSISGVEGLQWYAGPGLQLRSFNYLYDSNGDGRLDTEGTALGLGPNGMAGLEWFFPQADFFSLFVDMGLYVEVVPRPWVVLNAGIGFHFNF
jgi:hypothetical protein